MKPMNEFNPLVSIGVPVYNGEKYIQTALNSLLAQGFHDFELIISDNYSTDRTLRICEEYAAKDDRIVLNRNTCNIGTINNFRLVLEKAQGKYFMWAAADDYWSPDFVSTLVNELEMRPEVGVAMCEFNRIFEDGKLFDTIRFENKGNPNGKGYYQMLRLLTSGKKYNLCIYGLFRTAVLKKAIKECYDVPGWDRVFMCQLALATKFVFVDRVLFSKTVFAESYEYRLPDEKFSRLLKGKYPELKILVALARMIKRSDAIAWYRKSYLPVALGRYGILLIVNRFGLKIKKHINPQIWNILKKI